MKVKINEKMKYKMLKECSKYSLCKTHIPYLG